MTDTRFHSQGTRLLVLLLVLGASCLIPAHAKSSDYDIVISGGRVIDPETGLDAVRNVGIRGARIAAVTEDAIRGQEMIDASGLIVAPGFIDLHSHGQTVAADRMQAFDGVTTALELESGILPIADWYQTQAATGRVLNYGTSAAWTFARIAEFEQIEPEADLRWFQAAFTRTKWVHEPASPQQVERIVAAIEQGLREGGLGIGINAGYSPGGGFRELLAVHQLAARYSVPTYTHVSCDSPVDPDSSAECVGQVIALASTTGNHAHICHLNSSSLRAIGVTADMVLKAQAYGIPVSTEAYTYGASSTTIGSAIFSPESMAAQQMSPRDIEYQGQRLNDETFARLRAEDPGAVVVKHFLDMPRERPILDQSVLMPGGVIASDAMPWIDSRTGDMPDSEAWPLPDTAFAHPRSAGTYTRLLANWVREDAVLELAEAIAKSSLLPARILESSVPQMRSKGRLQPGMDADIVVFDLATVQDRATFERPAQPSIGMIHVLVNGEPVIANGELRLDARAGQAIRRPATTDAM